MKNLLLFLIFSSILHEENQYLNNYETPIVLPYYNVHCLVAVF